MPLPIQGEQFPPLSWTLAFDQYDANAAWYEGNQRKIQAVTALAGSANRGDNPATHYNRSDGTRRTGGIRGFLTRFFNGTIVNIDENRTRIHAPIAGNLATLSSDLLFAEPPTFRLAQTSGPDSGKTLAGPVQARLDLMMNGEDTHRVLSHAGENAAGLSAVVLTANWDKNVCDYPWLDFVACDAAVPEFAGRQLVAVNLFTAYPDQNNGGLVEAMYFHIERHERGKIIHGLVRATTWGQIDGYFPLATIGATAHIPDIPGSQMGEIPNTVVLPTGVDQITARWWRNLPTKTFRNYGILANMGRADFEGVEQFLDAADEVWSSWMRDIKIARARLIVPESFLDVQGPGLGGAFDDDREILTALAFTDLGADQSSISAHQFLIRAQEHASTLLGITKEITQAAGYSMSSYGEQATNPGGAATATEVTDRTTLTERTRDKKFLYFAQAARPMAEVLMALDAVHFGSGRMPADAELSIEIPDLSQIDPEKEARVFQYLRSAMAASTDTIVRQLHPDWDNTQILREIEAIQIENNLTPDPDPGMVDNVDPNVPQEDPANPGYDMEGEPMPPKDPTVPGEQPQLIGPHKASTEPTGK